MNPRVVEIRIMESWNRVAKIFKRNIPACSTAIPSSRNIVQEALDYLQSGEVDHPIYSIETTTDERGNQ